MELTAMIKRKDYLNWLITNRNTSLIKVISGVRRSGKSTLFEIYKNYLKEELQVTDEQIIHLNFEDLSYYEQRDFLKLNSYILDLTKQPQQYYIFFDEIQHVYKFEEVVNSLNLKKNLDIYITGSNAYFMSGELATLLTGRYTTLEILPLSFKEYQSQFVGLPLNEVYQNYRKTSFPYLVNETDLSRRNDYIRSLYHDIVLKDIVDRYKIAEVGILERILRFLMSSIGTEISINKIANYLISQNVKVSNITIEKYVDAFVGALILYKVPRYDVKGKHLMQRLEKYYVVDLGFRWFLLPNAREDAGHILENLVYLELRRRYPTVYVGRSAQYEVDFVCLDHNANPTYYQVALQTIDENVLDRELRSLEAIKDNRPKYLLTLDTHEKEADYDGIKKLNAYDWLMIESSETG